MESNETQHLQSCLKELLSHLREDSFFQKKGRSWSKSRHLKDIESMLDEELSYSVLAYVVGLAAAKGRRFSIHNNPEDLPAPRAPEYIVGQVGCMC